MSVTFATYRGINKQYQFIEQGKQIAVQISNLSGKLMQILNVERAQLPNPIKHSFADSQDHIKWLLNQGYYVYDRDNQVIFSPSLVGGMKRSQVQEIPLNEVTLEKPIGQGGFGQVFLGKWQGKYVAIKKLFGPSDPQLQNELLEEGTVMATLNHPNIVRLYGIFKGQEHGLVMEFAERGSLYSLIQNGTIHQKSQSEKIQVALQIVYGLSYLHGNNIIHRDLKSLNVLITKDFEARLADFGLARIKSSASSTMTKGAGTVAWMAPEVITAKKYSEEIDIYSFGMVLWEIIEEKIPFQGEEVVHILMKLMQTGMKEEKISEGTNKVLASIIRACWQTEPAKRPQLKQIEMNLKGLIEGTKDLPKSMEGLSIQQRDANLNNANPVIKIAPQPVSSLPLPDIAFGKAKWEQYFGDVGVEPALPSNIDAILNSSCPFWSGKKVKDTHMLVLIPKTVNGKPLTLDYMGQLIHNPKQGNKTQYSHFNHNGYNKTSAEQSHWILMTRELIPDSLNKSYPHQLQLIQSYNQKSGTTHEVPKYLDATVCIFLEYVQSGTRLYSDNPLTNIRCQEKGQYGQMVVGGFSSAGLSLSGSYYNYDAIYCCGVSVFRKF